MATLKELLGDGYNENLTHAEIDSLLSSKKFFDLSSGNYVSLGKHKALEREKESLEREKEALEREKEELNQKYLDKLTDEERREKEIAEREARCKQIERENTIGKYAKTLSRIKDENLKMEIAELLADGKTLEAIEKQNEYETSQDTQREATIRQELLSKNPEPPATNTNTSVKTKQDILNISDPFERQAEIEKNIELFTERN
jgi:hypothetical protein